jgi:hypothetical protein
MAKLVNLDLFSIRFGLANGAFDAAGLIDPILNCDTKLFIDPLLLASSANKTIRIRAHKLLKDRFGNIIKLVAVSKAHGDKA